MGYRVLTFNFHIGDEGVSQTDGGDAGALVTIADNLVPPFGWTIINFIGLTSPGTLGEGAPSFPCASPQIGIPSDDGTTPWSINVLVNQIDAYPLAADTLVLTVTAIAGD